MLYAYIMHNQTLPTYLSLYLSLVLMCLRLEPHYVTNTHSLPVFPERMDASKCAWIAIYYLSVIVVGCNDVLCAACLPEQRCAPCLPNTHANTDEAQTESWRSACTDAHLNGPALWWFVFFHFDMHMHVYSRYTYRVYSVLSVQGALHWIFWIMHGT